MEIRLSKDGLTKTGVILILLSGLVFHDFFALKYIKLGMITLTYLRVVLVFTVPLLLFMYKVRIRKNDVLAYILMIFMAYGLTRIEGNFKEAFALYCPIIAFFILYFSIDDKKVIDKCINFLAVLFMFFCLVGLFEIISGVHFVETRLDIMEDDKRVAFGMYYNENDFSAFLSVMVIYLLLSRFKLITKLLFITMSLVIICFNSSIVCLLGLMSFALIAFILRYRKHRFLRLILTVLLSLLLIKPVTDMVNSSSLWWRKYMYSFGIKNVMAHMWFGTGIGNYGKEMKAMGFDDTAYAVSADPHNLFYELAGVFGIVWAVLLIILLLKLLVFYFKKTNVKDYIYYLGLVYIVIFVGFASSSCMEKNYIYLALLIPVVYYRLCTSNIEAALHFKRYIAVTKA
ncbi:MAG: O-antigen ligase family protein [Clostridiales bacterium]|nr:O-antigen ligase family protein [Clostridiales bacterium]